MNSFNQTQSVPGQSAPGMNQTQGMCLLPGGVPITIQNASSWGSVGCLDGFYCELSFPKSAFRSKGI